MSICTFVCSNHLPVQVNKLPRIVFYVLTKNNVNVSLRADQAIQLQTREKPTHLSDESGEVSSSNETQTHALEDKKYLTCHISASYVTCKHFYPQLFQYGAGYYYRGTA